MILYFADRRFNILEQASTKLPEGITIRDDRKVEDIESGVSSFECYVPFTSELRERVQKCAKVGNFILRSHNGVNEFFTIMETEVNVKEGEVYVYAEDAGLDLLNEIVGAYEATEAKTIKHYIEQFAVDSGFVVGVNEIASLKRKLSWDGEETVTARLASVATQFDAEIDYSFEVKGLKVVKKLINVYKERGQDAGVQLRLNKEVDNIVTSENVMNVATALRVTGGTPEDAEGAITLDGYKYDDGDFFLDGTYLKTRKGNAVWSRYLAETGNGTGYICKRFEYDTLDKKELLNRAISELKKLREVEVNYEVDITSLPDDVRIGDRVNIVDDAGELYLSARILVLETSVANQEQKATLGEHIIKNSGISKKVEDLAAEFAKQAQKTLQAYNEAKKAQESANNAQQSADDAQSTVENVEKDVEELGASVGDAKALAEAAQAKADEAEAHAQTAITEASNAQTAASNAQNLAGTASTKADEAKEFASGATTAAQNAQITANAAKIDAEKAIEDVNALGDRLTTVSNTMEADYARKTELTETTANLQSQISQNAAQITTTVNKVLEVDETANNAQEQADAAQTAANAAQAAVDSLAVRVTEAETSIRQTSEEIELTASKVETVSAEANKSVKDVKRYYCLDTELPEKPSSYPPIAGAIETYTFNGNETVTWKGVTFEYASGVPESQLFGFVSKKKNNGTGTEFNTAPVLYSESCTLYVMIGGESSSWWQESSWGEYVNFVMGIAIKNDNTVMDDGTVFPKAGVWIIKTERDISVTFPHPALIWNGDTTGRDSIEGAFFKVTSEVPEGYSLEGKLFTLSAMGQTQTGELTSDDIGDAYDGTGKAMVVFLDGTPLCFVFYEDVHDAESGLSVSKGIYFMSMEMEGTTIIVTHLSGAGTAASQTWTETEPTAETGKNLYSVLCTILRDGSFSYSDVSLSSALAVAEDVSQRLDSDYMTQTETEAKIKVESDKITSVTSRVDEQGTKISTLEQTAQGLSVSLSEVQTDVDNAHSKADSAASAASTAQSTANTANTNATNAAKTASNFLSYDSTNGLLVGNKSSGSWSGYRAQVKSDSFNILDASGNVKSSFGANTIELGKGDNNAVVKFCNGKGQIKYNSTDDYTNISANRLDLESTNVSNGYARLRSTYKDPNTAGTSMSEVYTSSIVAGSGYAGVAVATKYEDADGNPVEGAYSTTGITVHPNAITLETDADGYVRVVSDTTTFEGDTGITGHYYDNQGQPLRNGLVAYSSSGIDPNTTLEEVILTNKNVPISGTFMYIRTTFYSTKSINANRMQLAFPYKTTVSGSYPYYRVYMDGAWCPWYKIITCSNDANTAVNIGAGWLTAGSIELSASQPFIDFHYGSSTADYTTRIISTNKNVIDIVGGDYGLRINTGAGVVAPTSNGGISLGAANLRFYVIRLQNSPDVSSLVELKTNIVPFERALSEIEKTDVFNYNLKEKLEREGKDITHTGFVIGEGYNCSDLLIADSGEGIDLYNAIGLAFGGVKELHEIVKKQQSEIDLLKEQVSLLKEQLEMLKKGGE